MSEPTERETALLNEALEMVARLGDALPKGLRLIGVVIDDNNNFAMTADPDSSNAELGCVFVTCMKMIATRPFRVVVDDSAPDTVRSPNAVPCDCPVCVTVQEAEARKLAEQVTP